MIDYATWCAIRDGAAQHLNPEQISSALGLNVKTVRRWLDRPYAQRQTARRGSKLDPFKGRIVRWLEAHPLSAQQVFQPHRRGLPRRHQHRQGLRAFHPATSARSLPDARLRTRQGRTSGLGRVRHDRRRQYPAPPVVLRHGARLESADVVEFTLSQTMEQFLAAHVNAFHALGVPKKVMVDNLRCAVVAHSRGGPAEIHPRYPDFARHYGFEIVACAVAKGNEKGRVERGVGYVKGNVLSGLELPNFAALNPALRVWLESVANVRLHRETHRRPLDLWQEERAHLQAVNPRPFDVARVLALRANRQFRVSFESNRYSVPARFAGRPVTVKVYPDRLCLYDGETLIARHARSFERHRDMEDPDHAKALVAQRRHARDAHALKRFLALSPLAEKDHVGLVERRGNALAHVRQIVALAEIHGDEPIVRALADRLAFDAFSSEYIAHLVAARNRRLPEASPLSLMRHQDVLDLELPPADLSAYAKVTGDTNGTL